MDTNPQMILMLGLAEKNFKESIKTMPIEGKRNMLPVKEKIGISHQRNKKGTGWKSLKMLSKT